MSRTKRSWRRCSTSTSPKSSSPRTMRCGRARRLPAPSVWTECRGSPSWSKRRLVPNARDPGKFSRPWARIPNIPMCRRAMPRRCGNGRRWGLLSDIYRRPCRTQGPTTGVRDKKDNDPESFKQETTRRRAERNRAHAGGPRFRGADVEFCIGRQIMTPHLRLGIIAAVAVLALDQASKLWLLRVFDIGHRGSVKLAPFFDLVLAWNPGISFGWLQNDSPLAQIALLIVKAVAVVVLAIWMARSRTVLATVALGLIIGGAIGNAIDRLAYGAVVDF